MGKYEILHDIEMDLKVVNLKLEYFAREMALAANDYTERFLIDKRLELLKERAVLITFQKQVA